MTIFSTWEPPAPRPGHSETSRGVGREASRPASREQHACGVVVGLALFPLQLNMESKRNSVSMFSALGVKPKERTENVIKHFRGQHKHWQEGLTKSK